MQKIIQKTDVENLVTGQVLEQMGSTPHDIIQMEAVISCMRDFIFKKKQWDSLVRFANKNYGLTAKELMEHEV